MSLLKAWIKASRFASQSYIFIPLFVGEMFYVMTGGHINWTVFAIVHLYGLFMQLYIIYANDYADAKTDELNETFTIFSGGSRVLVDGDLSRRALGIAAIAMAVLCVLAGVWLAVQFNRIYAPLLIALGILLLWMYSFGPVKLSYRGGGEFLQMLGIGIILPLVGFYAQGGAPSQFPMETLAVILPTQLACAMATSIPDFSSDKQSHKRTFSVLLGRTRVRMLIIGLNLLAIGAFFAIRWASFEELKMALPLFVLLGVAVSLFSLVKKIHGKWAIFLFVMFSIVLTLGLMGQLAYVASNMHS
ncbi:MAG: prenyltransferase [Deltaproteobacteria bacterium]|nr:prenyltransferase [Deltaproteobacteria bacterium]